MTDTLLKGKFHGLADAVLGQAPSALLIAQCGRLGEAGNVRALIQLATPQRP